MWLVMQIFCRKSPILDCIGSSVDYCFMWFAACYLLYLSFWCVPIWWGNMDSGPQFLSQIFLVLIHKSFKRSGDMFWASIAGSIVVSVGGWLIQNIFSWRCSGWCPWFNLRLNGSKSQIICLARWMRSILIIKIVVPMFIGWNGGIENLCWRVENFRVSVISTWRRKSWWWGEATRWLGQVVQRRICPSVRKWNVVFHLSFVAVPPRVI